MDTPTHEDFHAWPQWWRWVAVLTAAWHHRVRYQPVSSAYSYYMRITPFEPITRITAEAKELMEGGFLYRHPSANHWRRGRLLLTEAGLQVIATVLTRELMNLYGVPSRPTETA